MICKVIQIDIIVHYAQMLLKIAKVLPRRRSRSLAIDVSVLVCFALVCSQSPLCMRSLRRQLCCSVHVMIPYSINRCSAHFARDCNRSPSCCGFSMQISMTTRSGARYSKDEEDAKKQGFTVGDLIKEFTPEMKEEFMKVCGRCVLIIERACCCRTSRHEIKIR